MEKYIIVLIILAMMFFIFCTFPILAKEPSKAYILTRSSYLGDKMLSYSEKWQTNSYYVYKIAPNLAENIIPNSKIIYEYFFNSDNSIIKSTPYLKSQSTKLGVVYGVPYIID